MKDTTKQWFQVKAWGAATQIGYYPRVKEIESNVATLPYFEVPRSIIAAKKIVFDDRAVLTDAVFENANKGGSAWIVSEKLKQVLRSFKLPSHGFYDITVAMKGREKITTDYGLFIIFQDLSDNLIDFPKSKFRTVSQVSFLKKDESQNFIHIASRDDYVRQLKDQSNLVKDIYPVSLRLNGQIDVDLFALRPSKYYVSKELADAFRREQVTGFELMPIDFSIEENARKA